MRLLVALLILVASCAGTPAGKADSTPPTDCVTQSAPGNYPKDSCSCTAKLCEWYRFGQRYIDLEANEELKLTLLPAGDLKTCSKYRGRFVAQNEEVQALTWNGATFRITDKQELVIRHGAGEERYPLLKEPAVSPHEHPEAQLLAKDDGVVVLADDDDTCYTVAKYNAKGEQLFRTNVQHTYVDTSNNTRYYHPYLAIAAVLEEEIVFTTYAHDGKKVTVIVDLHTGKKAEYAYVSDGVVRDSTERRAAGLMEEKNDSTYIFHHLARNSTMEIPKQRWGEHCETLLSGDLLVIATYHRIATGCGLCCYNIRTKKMEWTANVLQLNTAHSQYRNRVMLSAYRNKVILEGNESHGDYVQLFDIETGKRLAEFGVVEQNGSGK